MEHIISKDVKKCQSFRKGWMQVPQGRVSIVRQKLMDVLGITSEPAWYRRLNGTVSPTVEEVIAIEGVFKDENISAIWGK